MDLFDLAAGGAGPSGSSDQPDRVQCSAKGCRREGRWAVRWNNPKLHPPERRKIWLACEDHRDDLQGFLTVRGMWRETVPIEELPA